VLYRHFESKQALFLEVLAEIRAATVDRCARETAGLTDPLAKLHAVMDRYLGSALRACPRIRILHRSLIETDRPEIAGVFCARSTSTVKPLLAQIIRRKASKLAFSGRKPRPAALRCLGVDSARHWLQLTLPLGIPLVPGSRLPAGAIECLLHCLLKTDI